MVEGVPEYRRGQQHSSSGELMLRQPLSFESIERTANEFLEMSVGGWNISWPT
jgi:hypothetical protein